MQELRLCFPVAKAVNCTIPKVESISIVQLGLLSMHLVMGILIGSGLLHNKLMFLLTLVMPTIRLLRWILQNVLWLILLPIEYFLPTLERKQMKLLLSFPGSFKDLYIRMRNSLPQISSPLRIASMGEGGIYSAKREFLQALRTACDDAASLLVFDEVHCGLGRTDYLWAHEAYGVFPDIMTLAKPLAGGLPIGVTLVTEKVASAMLHGDHGSTFAGGKPHVKGIRGWGLMIGIELDMSASPLVDACRNSGLIVLTAGKGNVGATIDHLRGRIKTCS